LDWCNRRDHWSTHCSLSSIGTKKYSRIDIIIYVITIQKATSAICRMIFFSTYPIIENSRTMRSTEHLPASRSVLGRFAPGTDRARDSHR
jgi:hypothetical protein